MQDVFPEYKGIFDRIKAKVAASQSILIVPHDFPDPDAIAAAVGLKHLFTELNVPQCDIAFAGFIGRAENRAMIELLKIEFLNLNKIDLTTYDTIISVDSVPNNGNVSITDISLVDIVIDHHPLTDVIKEPNTLYEVHTDVGATSTLVTMLCVLANIAIPARVATALFYGIKTDTNDMARNCHTVDIQCYKILFDLIEHATLSRIESPQREQEYFVLLHSAAEAFMKCGDIAHSHLGLVTVPDYVPEMADIFHSIRELEWMVCSAIFGDLLIYSIRSKKDQTAGEKARSLAKKFNGSGGGHPTVAAGRIPLGDLHPTVLLEAFMNELRFLFDVHNAIPTKLVTK